MNRNPFSPIRSLLGVLAIGLWLSCSATPPTEEEDRQAIDNLFEKRRVAMEARDVEGVLSCFSKDYKDPFGGLAELRVTVEEIIGKATRLSVQTGARKIFLEKDRALVRQRYVLESEMEGEEHRLNGSEEFTLQRERNGWRIVGGPVPD